MQPEMFSNMCGRDTLSTVNQGNSGTNSGAKSSEEIKSSEGISKSEEYWPERR